MMARFIVLDSDLEPIQIYSDLVQQFELEFSRINILSYLIKAVCF